MNTNITCRHCGGALGPGDRFCAQCGAELLWCASCGEFLLQSEQSCPKCGTPGIPKPESHTIPYELTEADSPWIEVVARLRRATHGEFEIGQELGRGGMAAVFLAHEISLHRDVAIKVMSPGLLMGDGMIERFKREAITIAHLNHPNIVSVYSVRAAEGLHFFVMRCIQGRSLEQVIKQAGRLPVPIVLSILHQVGSALAYAHRFRVVHRDIKPANILIDEDGNAVVTDFGIAKATEGPSHTHTGFMVGTPAYMSPEQCAGAEVSGASDQYSLGAVAYEMITGVPPFTGSTYSVIQAHVERPPRPLREHHDDCPPELEAAILRMLAKDPNERWPGMQQALGALGAAPLMEEDPLRAELSRLSTSGLRMGFSGEPTPISRPPRGKASAVQTPPGMVRAITILPPPPALEVGDSFLLVARLHEGHAARLPGRPVEWSSSAPGVLRVNATKAVATAITPGSAVITATSDGNEGRLRVTVAPPRADAIAIKPVEKPIRVGDEVRLEATPRDKRGRVVSRPITWNSENDSVATISLDGMLVARSPGSTQITAELDEARADLPVTVLPAAVAAVHISPPPESVTAGESFALTATPLDRWAGPLMDRPVAWSVSDVSVAVVTAGGWVITRNPGLVVLTATCEGASASVSVTVADRVSAPFAAGIRASPATSGPRSGVEAWDIEPVEPRRAERAEPRRSRSRPSGVVIAGGAFLLFGGLWLAGGRRAVTGPSEWETAQVTPDSASRLVASAGASERSAEPVTAGDSARPASVIITRRPGEPVLAGTSTLLEAEVRDYRGRLVPDARVGWSSTSPEVILVDSATGTLQALASGRAQVVAAIGDWRDSARILVRDTSAGTSAALLRTGQAASPRSGKPVASVSISPHDGLRVGDTATLGAAVLSTEGDRLRDARVRWSSSEPAVAEVDARTGRVRAHAPGTTVIIARSGSESAISSLTVLPAPVASVGIEGARPLKVGDTLALRAEPRDARGGGLSERPVIWSSSDTAVATVDSASGVVVSRAPGSAQIQATVEGKSGQVSVTVLPQPRTGRAEQPLEAVAPPPGGPSPEDVAAERQRILDQMRAGVEQCYGALQHKDVARLAQIYNSASKADQEKLNKLSRILRTHEWGAVVGEREDGAQRVEAGTAAMEFSFRLTWKDAFGGRLSSQPVFRAEFAKNGSSWDLSSCRIIGSPKL
jgi:serine/threonine protein kinase/acyl dehydratase